MTGREVVAWVDQGNVVNDVPFSEWWETQKGEILFGPRTSAELKSSIAKLMYVFQKAVAADPAKPGAMKDVGFM